ncbi:MAG: TIGR00296 family protein [Candidatus Aenigmarchaeota archaeon]|nr:TIGR00296 family protein [Candidatus Aenigmarchaeota archaeon]
MAISVKGGEFLVKLSRDSIKYYLQNLVPMPPPKMFPIELKAKQGAFCTLLTYPSEKLRGCIGVIVPEKNLVETITGVSCSATQDPRFFPMQEFELDETIIEVTVLSPMEKITVFEPRDYLKEVSIGKDGLFIRSGFHSGVFLPQVPVEQGWDVKTYLCELCHKAGLDRDAWIVSPVQIYRFQAQIFAETDPEGSVYEKKLETMGEDE